MSREERARRIQIGKHSDRTGWQEEKGRRYEQSAQVEWNRSSGTRNPARGERRSDSTERKPTSNFWFRKHLSSILMAVVFLIGLSLILYPSVSDWWNSMHQTRAITDYASAVSVIDNSLYESLWKEAAAYNQRLYEKGGGLELPEDALEEYESMLNISESGMMSYIEIPKIQCSLPIYHGTEESVLQTAIGHIEGSSLPVGGKSTHCVLSGHRGLPSARLFSDLDELVEGDRFLIRTLDETLTYEVDQILIVLPEEVDALAIQEGEDLCTLVTCTPYGVNSHRLLVQGHRVANQDAEGAVRVTADAVRIEPVLVAPFVAIPILGILLIFLLAGNRRKK